MVSSGGAVTSWNLRRRAAGACRRGGDSRVFTRRTAGRIKDDTESQSAQKTAARKDILRPAAQCSSSQYFRLVAGYPVAASFARFEVNRPELVQEPPPKYDAGSSESISALFRQKP